jgi:hypothetical protein
MSANEALVFPALWVLLTWALWRFAHRY